MLADAFGRPPGSGDSLGRPPAEPQMPPEAEPGNPWRDPTADVQLGAPAVAEPATEAAPSVPAERFTLRQALFERRIRPSALAGLAVLALLIGCVGAFIGVWAGGRLPAAITDPAFTVAGVSPAIERPAGSVAAIAKA